MNAPFAIIVEDDPKLGIIYEKALERAGFQTFLDARGNQFLGKLSHPDLSIIVLDLHLPYVSGVEVLKMIREMPAGRDVPVIVLTADFILAKTITSLADKILIKPVSLNRLIGLINELLEREQTDFE
jgi:DNA-binding response OmpR family regulator